MRARRRQVRFTAAYLLVLIVGGSVWWGIHPPRTDEAYRRESASTLALLRSDVETAKLWVGSFDQEKVTGPATEVALTEAETDAARRSSTYASYQPPNPALVDLRADVTALADQVVSTLGEVRVDARAARWEEVAAAWSHLDRLSGQLHALRQEVAR